MKYEGRSREEIDRRIRRKKKGAFNGVNVTLGITKKTIRVKNYSSKCDLRKNLKGVKKTREWVTAF